MVEIATLEAEATSLNDGDLAEVATEQFDILAMTVKDDALLIIWGITNFNGLRGMETHGGLVCSPLIQRRRWWRLCESCVRKGRRG